ncbi:MAG: hypothetical protein M3178_12985 [Pseudomonadota bacterium]|nr:hypothetical protein [Pseudomonadota bacterium]
MFPYLPRPGGGPFFAPASGRSIDAGLDRQDGGRIAEARKEADIPYDVNSAGKPVLVCYRESAPTQFGKLEKMTGDSIPPANSGYICR